MRALLVSDLEDWILGEIGRRLLGLHRDTMPTELLAADAAGFARSLEQAQRAADVVHFLSPWTFLEHSHRVGIPCVATIAHLVEDSWPVVLAAAARLDGVSAMSAAWRDALAARLPAKLPIHHTRFGLDTERFRPISEARDAFLAERRLDPATLVVGFAGSSWSNESERKGLDRLWEVMARLEQVLKRPHVLRLAGRGWTPDTVPAELRHRVLVEDMLGREALPALYASLDLYLCLSRVEGGPYPVLETMACGKVVAATPVGQVPEVVRHGVNGFVLGQATAVEDAITAVLAVASDCQLAATIGDSARRAMVDEYAWDRVAPHLGLDELYGRAAAHYRTRPPWSRAGLRARAALYRAGGRWAPTGLRSALGRTLARRTR